MWEKSEKHLALGLLFTIAAAPLTNWVGFVLSAFGLIHCGVSMYHAFKE